MVWSVLFGEHPRMIALVSGQRPIGCGSAPKRDSGIMRRKRSNLFRNADFCGVPLRRLFTVCAISALGLSEYSLFLDVIDIKESQTGSMAQVDWKAWKGAGAIA
jgi:hypothetical protein